MDGNRERLGSAVIDTEENKKGAAGDSMLNKKKVVAF